MTTSSHRDQPMLLAAFASASMTHGGVGAWTHPSTDLAITGPDYYVNLARTLDAAGFDLLFFDDRLAMPAAYGGSIEAAARLGSRAVKLDLLVILALVATHTRRIGLGATYSTTYYEPYHVARAFATLDHLSGGRAAWNIVTSLNAEEAENFGRAHLDPAGRYDRADEFLQIATALWHSWDADAVLADRATGQFTSPGSVHPIDFAGDLLSSRGPLTVPRSPQGWPTLIQAGQSGRGMSFAARWADITFTNPASMDGARRYREDLLALAADAGRDVRRMRVMPAVQPIVAPTRELAQQKLALIDSLVDAEEELVVISEQANLDLSTLPLDQPIPDDLLDRVTGTRGLLEGYLSKVRAVHGPQATMRDLAMSRRFRQVRFVGTAADVADEMTAWFDEGACDGFAIVPTDTPGSFEDVARLVIPELRRRGLLPASDAGAGDPLRERIGLTPR